MRQTPLVAAPGDMLVGILAPMLALRGPLPCAAGSSSVVCAAAPEQTEQHAEPELPIGVQVCVSELGPETVRYWTDRFVRIRPTQYSRV